MLNIAIVIKSVYSYAGTENICNFMSDCFGADHNVTIYSLEGGGTPFYPFEKVSEIKNLSNKKNP